LASKRQKEADEQDSLNKFVPSESDAQLEVITFSAAVYSPKSEYLRKALPLIDKYGMDAMPALFINGELVLYGGVPSTEKLSEVIGKAANPTKKEAK